MNLNGQETVFKRYRIPNFLEKKESKRSNEPYRSFVPNENYEKKNTNSSINLDKFEHLVNDSVKKNNSMKAEANTTFYSEPKPDRSANQIEIESNKKIKDSIYLYKYDSIQYKDFDKKVHTLSKKGKIQKSNIEKLVLGETLIFKKKIELTNGVIFKEEAIEVTDAYLDSQKVEIKSRFVDSLLERIKNDSSYKCILKKNENIPIKKYYRKPYKVYGDVILEKNKLIVNPYLYRNKEGKISRDTYAFEMKNRRTAKLRFNEFTISALVIPIKYRFEVDKGGDLPNIDETFETDFNANLSFNFGLGKTKFFYKEKVGNKSNTWIFSLSPFIGASVVELNSKNTSGSSKPLEEEVELNRGLLSLGCGITFTYNKINIGGFYGWDWAVGESTQKWNYQNKPWLGVGLGYSILYK